MKPRVPFDKFDLCTAYRGKESGLWYADIPPNASIESFDPSDDERTILLRVRVPIDPELPSTMTALRLTYWGTEGWRLSRERSNADEGVDQ